MITRNRYGQPNQTLTCDEQNRLVQVAIAGGSTVQYGYSAGGARLWKKVNGQITGLWIGSLYEEKDGKVLCHVYAAGQLVATFEPEGGFACFLQHHPYLTAIWNVGDGVGTALFGDGRTPVTVMWAAALTGIALGLRYNRRRLQTRYGLDAYYGLRSIGGTDPWRQMVLLCLAASIFLSSNPQAVYAGTPDYDPVFYYYHPDHLGSSQLMTDRDGDVVQQYGYSPFGRENYKNNTYAFSVSNRYTGQTLDEETGLYYYGARYYDPELARFIQADSIIPDPEFSQAYNRYAYVYNNPLKFTDPTGQFPWLVPLIVSMAKGALIGGAIGAGLSAAMGGDPLKGFLAGAIGGAFGGIGGFLNLGPVGMGLMGAAGGALGALATGGDPVMGAISAGITSGMAAAMQFSPIASFEDLFTEQALKQLTISTTVGAAVGGITAEMFGGDFGQGAASGAAGSAAGFVMSVSLRQFIEPVAQFVAEQIANVVDIAVAFVQDRIYGSVETLTIWGRGINETNWREITVKAYRLNEKLGTSWAISKDMIHTSKIVTDTLRAAGADGASRLYFAFDDSRGSWGQVVSDTGWGANWAEKHIAHEIGHTAQAMKMGPLYLPLTVPTTNFFKVPVLNSFERDASYRGQYGGIR